MSTPLLRHLLTLALGTSLAGLAAAQAVQPARPEATRRVGPVQGGGDWRSLSAAEQRALAPLQRDWAQLDPAQKEKWVEIAQRLPSMNAEQQQRIQARMADWARMTPAERGQARLRFLQAQRTAPEGRGDRWGDYQALPSDEKRQFAARAALPAASAASKARSVAGPRRNDPEAPIAKSNLVTNPNFSAQPRPIAPTTLKAGPGASTTLVSKPPTPPPHQQTGLPKIAATPGFVDRSTLLPQRGPQGAATALPVGGGTPAPVPRP